MYIYFTCSYFSTETKHLFGIKRAHLHLILCNTLFLIMIQESKPSLSLNIKSMWWNAKSALSRQKQNKVQIPSSCTNQTKNYDNLQKSKLRHIRMKYSLKLSKSAAVG